MKTKGQCCPKCGAPVGFEAVITRLGLGATTHAMLVYLARQPAGYFTKTAALEDYVYANNPNGNAHVAVLASRVRAALKTVGIKLVGKMGPFSPGYRLEWA